MFINRCFKFRIYPTSDQIDSIVKIFGCRRFVYNQYVEQRENFYKEYKKQKDFLNFNKPTSNITDLELTKIKTKFSYKSEVELKTEFPFLAEKRIPASALQQARMDAEEAYSRYFISLREMKEKHLKEPKFGKPHFKSKKNNYQSFRVTMLPKKVLDECARTVFIPVLKEVLFRNGKIPTWFKQKNISYQNITVSKDPSGKFYASICCKYNTEEREKIYSGIENKSIGLDFSPSKCYIDSNNQEAPNYVPLKQKLKRKLARLQNIHARRGLKRDLNNKVSHDKNGQLVIVGSKNREKSRIKLAKFEEYISNKRKDYIEKETLRLVKSYEVIGLETLNIKGLMKKTDKNGTKIKYKNAKSYVDVSWSKFEYTLNWKSRFNNCFVVNADKWFPSSQLCSFCGFRFNGTKDLRVRAWKCPKCGIKHDRDQNAALNLRKNALLFLSDLNKGIVGTTRASSKKKTEEVFYTTYACGEYLKPVNGGRYLKKQEESNVSSFIESNGL